LRVYDTEIYVREGVKKGVSKEGEEWRGNKKKVVLMYPKPD